MTLQTVLLIAISVVGIVAARALRSIQHELTLWRTEWRAAHVPLFTDAPAAQQKRTEKARCTAGELTDDWTEKWAGKTLQSSEDEAESWRQTLEVNYKRTEHDPEVHHLSMMIPANARVRLWKRAVDGCPQSSL